MTNDIMPKLHHNCKLTKELKLQIEFAIQHTRMPKKLIAEKLNINRQALYRYIRLLKLKEQ